MREIRAHTGLRGIAAISVFLGHAGFDQIWRDSPWWMLPYRLFYWQDPAVDLFFMLSGFVLNYVYLKHRRRRWGAYVRSRLARICPLYYAGMGAVLAMNFYAARRGYPPSLNLREPVIIRNFLMVQEWPFGAAQTSIDTPEWSISVEMFLYLILFPVLALIFAGKRQSGALLLSILFILLLVLSIISPSGGPLFALPFAHLARGLAGFSAGFIVCDLVCEAVEVPFLGTASELALVFLTVLALPFVALHFILPFAFAALIGTTYSENSRLGRALGLPALNFLGLISYSIYIWHLPVIKVTSLVFGVRRMGANGLENGASVLRLASYVFGTIAAVLAVSAASYYYFENPLRRLLGRDGRAV